MMAAAAPAEHRATPTARPTASAPEAGRAPSVLSTLNEDGTRRWICPRPSPGRFLRARRIVAWVLILIFTVIPYIRVGGRPLMLLDVAARRFTIFGATFLPTDSLLLALLLVGITVTVFLVTALFGRVWCGWACPQTVYMEFVFRPIERLFKGTPGRRRAGGTGASGAGTVLKYAVYLLVSLYLAHTFLAYFVGVERLAQWVRRSPLEHPSSFLIMVVVTGLMMFDFSYFREQTCIVACPYGRFQSVMLDRQSLIITYDRRRGEPRGKVRARRPDRAAPAERVVALPVRPAPVRDGPRAEAPGAAGADWETRPTGDCVVCGLCVATCPTGIDIRNGLQMECIGCAQCIDACDAVMTKLGRPRGLIRYSSQAAVEGERPRLLRARVVVYPAILAVIASIFTGVLVTRAPADVTVLRGLGAPFSTMPDGRIGNAVRLKIVNRTDRAASYRFDAAAAEGPARVDVVAEEDPVAVEGGQSRTVPAMIVTDGSAFVRGTLDVQVRVTDGAAFTRTLRYRLLGPGSAAHPAANGAGSGGAR